jgi:hypothetical protein
VSSLTIFTSHFMMCCVPKRYGVVLKLALKYLNEVIWNVIDCVHNLGQPLSVVVRFKTYICGCSFAVIGGLNRAEVMDVRLWCCEFCRSRILRRADRSFRGDLQDVCVCLLVYDTETSVLVGGSRDRSPVVSLGIFSEATDGTMCPGVDSASRNEYQENSWE